MIFWIPLLKKSSDNLTYPGKCSSEHVGVNAPGTPINNTVLSSITFKNLTFSGPFSFILYTSTLSILSLTLYFIVLPH